jgi:hypothetical protein
MAGKFGLDPHQLDDETLERELRYLYATREETFFHGSRQALLNHTERMLQLEREYANRFPERTRPTPCGPARAPEARRASQPTVTSRVAQAVRQGDSPFSGDGAPPWASLSLDRHLVACRDRARESWRIADGSLSADR